MGFRISRDASALGLGYLFHLHPVLIRVLALTTFTTALLSGCTLYIMIVPLGVAIQKISLLLRLCRVSIKRIRSKQVAPSGKFVTIILQLCTQTRSIPYLASDV